MFVYWHLIDFYKIKNKIVRKLHFKLTTLTIN
jgi:hypothetical protein